MKRRPFSNKPAQFLTHQGGATMMVFGITGLILIMGAAVAIDVARIHAVNGKAQHALDAGVLSAASNAPVIKDKNPGCGEFNTGVTQEARSMFDSNYPPSYMGTTIANADFTITPPSGCAQTVGKYTGQVKVQVPMVLMSLFGHPTTTITVNAEATRDFSVSPDVTLELALVLDNTGSMQEVLGGVKKINALKNASNVLLNAIYGEIPNKPNVFISVVPYTTAVNISGDSSRGEWIKWRNNYQCIFYCGGGTTGEFKWANSTLSPPLPNVTGLKGFADNPEWVVNRVAYVANRDDDLPRENGGAGNPMELSDEPPTTEDSQFRTPRGYIVNLDPASNPDFYSKFNVTLPGVWSPALPQSTYDPDPSASGLPWTSWRDLSGDVPPVLFAESEKSAISSRIDSMTGNPSTTSMTRINVGLMWGWYTLSPKWAGKWAGGAKSDKPINPDLFPDRITRKAMILMTDGLNTVFTGGHPLVSNDDATTAALCERVRASGVDLYTVGFASSSGRINEPLLRGCAGNKDGNNPAWYYLATNQEELIKAFSDIGASVTSLSVNLTK